MQTQKFTFMKTKIVALACLVAFGLYSCNSGSGTKQASEAPKKAEQKENVIKEVSDYPMPSAFDVTKMLNQAGASYILAISNPTTSVEKYFTAKEKAINLGIYGADLAYASTYEMKQETMLYLKAAKQLIDGLEISSNFNMSFAQRVESNIDDKDSLINIISNSFYDTYEFLNNNGKDNLSLLIMSGSFIEGLYITSQIGLSANDPAKFNKILANQKSSIAKLIELLTPVKAEADIADIYADLEKLNAIYAVEGELSADQLKKVVDLVAEIRTKLV